MNDLLIFLLLGSIKTSWDLYEGLSGVQEGEGEIW